MGKVPTRPPPYPHRTRCGKNGKKAELISLKGDVKEIQKNKKIKNKK